MGEFDKLVALGGLTPATVIIHGAALSRAEGVWHLGHQSRGAAVLDDLAELVEQQVAV
jgi:hypothetical protein